MTGVRVHNALFFTPVTSFDSSFFKISSILLSLGVTLKEALLIL